MNITKKIITHEECCKCKRDHGTVPVECKCACHEEELNKENQRINDDMNKEQQRINDLHRGEEDKREEWEKEFDNQILGKGFGAENLQLFTIPFITDKCKFWAMENKTEDIKVFIHSLLEEKERELRERYP